MRMIQKTRNPIINTLQPATVVPQIRVTGGIATAIHAADVDEVVTQYAVAGDGSELGLPGVAVGIDEAGGDDGVGAVNGGCS